MPRPFTVAIAMRDERFHGWLVAGTAAVVLLTCLDAAPLWDDDEPKNAACSLAMLDAHDWVVPTFDGRLRIEKPPLVNWVHLAGVAVCGRNETGVRIGSALLTIGTCLLTWQIGRLLFGPAVGLLGGLAMATCLWTAVGGRAATPDAPLVFCTTLALFLFTRALARGERGCTPIRLSLPVAMGIGAACGAAVLAKGPIGVVLPCGAFAAFAVWRGLGRPGTTLRDTVAGLRPLTIAAATLAVALPWYAWVTLRTDGAWLRGFLLVHNAGRFAAPMEGHSGSLLYYPTVIAIGLFPWSIVLVAMLAHAGAVLRAADDRQRAGMQVLACWAAVWGGVLSIAGTKLPGYIWPAYPALAVATGVFLDAAIRRDVPWLQRLRNPQRGLDALMSLAWGCLALGGIVIAVGLPLAAARWAPGGQWLGLIGIVPIACAALVWRAADPPAMRRAVAALSITACLLSTLLATVAAGRLGRTASPRALLAAAADRLPRSALASFPHTPPSLVFYAGGPVDRLDTPDDVARHLAARPDAHAIVDSRVVDQVLPVVPAGCGVVAQVHTISARDLVLIGPLAAAASRLARHEHRPSD